MNKIVLGTAQFGMDYGVNNKRGEIPEAEAFKILNKAIKFGIDTIDTAYTYGKSEIVLGSFFKSRHNKLKIISKLPNCESKEIKKILKSSLNRLNASSFYGYLIHSYENYKKDQMIWKELKNIKDDGQTKNIGFSLYFPSQLESLLRDGVKFDMLQVPFSIFDRRFEPYFPKLKKRKIEIYVRSVFLQGLVFKKPDELNGYFEKIKGKFEDLNSISKESGIPIFALCLGFVMRNKFIDKVIVGVDRLEHLNEIMQGAKFLKKSANLDFSSLLAINDEKITLPIYWP